MRKLFFPKEENGLAICRDMFSSGMEIASKSFNVYLFLLFISDLSKKFSCFSSTYRNIYLFIISLLADSTKSSFFLLGISLQRCLLAIYQLIKENFLVFQHLQIHIFVHYQPLGRINKEFFFFYYISLAKVSDNCDNIIMS